MLNKNEKAHAVEARATFKNQQADTINNITDLQQHFLLDGEKQTDKTDLTYSLSNQEFLEAIFGDSEDDALPIVVSFAGNPKNGNWSGKVWKTDNQHLSPDNNNYYSLAIFHPNEKGKYQRKAKYFAGLYAVVCDDVGTKVAGERIKLPPSYKLETSAGNYQFGYILDTPITEITLADKLMKAIIAAGLCDSGAGGVTTRLMRLPVAVNGKHQPAFRCRLTEWQQPELRYPVDELIKGLGLDMNQSTKATSKKNSKAKSSFRAEDNRVLFTPPDENAIVSALEERKLYKKPLGNGKHDIICPWVTEHTDEVDNGTAYFEPSEDYAIGGFKCQHGHCSERHMPDLLQYLGVEIEAARIKPTIRVTAGVIHRIVDAAEKILANAGYYQRGGLIISVAIDPSTKTIRLYEVNQSSLVMLLSATATWVNYDFTKIIDPPDRCITILHNNTRHNHLPILKGLAHQPYLHPDGSLVQVAGYDQVAEMYSSFAEDKFSVPEKPTIEQAREALAMLCGVLEEFPFSKGYDKSAALSTLLTAAIRPSLPHAPMFHVKAAMFGSGKSYICELMVAFAMPTINKPTAFPTDDTECQKQLLSLLLTAPAVIEFDNLTSDLLAHKSLCIALTQEYMSGRILGISKMAEVCTRTLFLSSGNNVSPVKDMTRRCITINLDPNCETPATREFKKPNLLVEVRANREKYVSAALTIIRAWIVAGRPKTQCKSIATYGEWSDLCRQPLLWLGLPDPATSVFEAMEDDPDREILGRLLAAWHENFGNKPTMVREAVTRAKDVFYSDNPDLLEILIDIAGERNDEINRRALGRWIKRHANRTVNGLRFVRASGSRSAEAWGAESVKSVL